MPWNGRAETRIDRFDIRHQMDMMPRDWDDTGDLVHADDGPGPGGSSTATGIEDRGPGVQDKRLECFFCYERYRALLEAARRGVDPDQPMHHVHKVAHEVRQKVAEAERKRQRSDLSGAPSKLPSKVPASAANQGQFSRKGYMYGGGNGTGSGAAERDSNTLALLDLVPLPDDTEVQPRSPLSC